VNSKTKNRKSQSKSSEKIKIEFTDQKLTNYAGLVAMEPFMNDWLGMRSMLNEDTLKLNRCPNFEYSSYDYISMVLCGILTGGDRMNKVSFMSRDKVLSHTFGWKGTPHAGSLARYFKSFESESIEALKTLIEKMRRKVWSRIRCQDVTIDNDSTVNTVYGKQEGACKGYNPDHRGEHSYHPLLAFVDRTQEVLNERLRPANCYTGKGVNEFIEDCLSNLPAHIRGVTIRGDSGFFDDDLLDKIESYQSKSCTYLIKGKMRNLDRVLADQEWEQSIDPDIMTCDFEYRCGNWQRARRFNGVKVKTDKTDHLRMVFRRINEWTDQRL